MSHKDFHHETTNDILAKVKELLEGYKVGAKAKYLGIVCKVSLETMATVKNNWILLPREDLVTFI